MASALRNGFELQEAFPSTDDERDKIPVKPTKITLLVEPPENAETHENDDNGITLEPERLIEETEEENKESLGLPKRLKTTPINKFWETVTPVALMRSHDENALLKAMEVIEWLKGAVHADEKGTAPDWKYREECRRLAHSLDDFAATLLDPLKVERREDSPRADFERSADIFLEKARRLKMKKFLCHDVVFEFLLHTWSIQSFYIHGDSVRNDLRFIALLELFAVELIFLPVILIWNMVVSYVQLKKKVAYIFVVIANGRDAEASFIRMKETIKYFIQKQGCKSTKYAIIQPSQDSAETTLGFDEDLSDMDALLRRVDGLEILPCDQEAFHLEHELSAAIQSYNSLDPGTCCVKLLTIFTDEDIHSRNVDRMDVLRQLDRLLKVNKFPNVKFIGLKEEWRDLDLYQHLKYCGVDSICDHDPSVLGQDLFKDHGRKTALRKQLDELSHPMRIFVQDTLSYLVLLILHIRICLRPVTVNCTKLERAIFVFFLGRMVMELAQFFEPNNISIRKKWRQYISDRWNVVDSLLVLIYCLLLVAWTSAWAASKSPDVHNHSLRLTGILYGVNAMILTFRVFGQVLETTKRMGTIQIALIQICGDVATILIQLFTIILAFSLAITKVLVDEKSFVNDTKNGTETLFCAENEENEYTSFTDMLFPGYSSCWLEVLKHMCWSVLGNPDEEKMDPPEDQGSAFVALSLYALFLIVGAILLINMMVALLSNTYKRVEDNSREKWRYSMAIKIQTYRNYHAVPVPLNLFSIPCLLYKCCTRQENSKGRNAKIQSTPLLDEVVNRLGKIYLSTHGNSFPAMVGKLIPNMTRDIGQLAGNCLFKTLGNPSDAKMDNVLGKIDENRRLICHVVQKQKQAHKIDLPVGPEAWETNGIKISGDGHTSSITRDEGEGISGCRCARYKVPFSWQHPKFEVVIQGQNDNAVISVGVVFEDNYRDDDSPGSNQYGTVEYEICSGIIFDMDHFKCGRTLKDAIAKPGDVVGIEIQTFVDIKGRARVTFSLNGRMVAEATMSPEGREIYPCVTMPSKGTCVVAKMCPETEVGATELEECRTDVKELKETVAKQQELLAGQHEVLTRQHQLLEDIHKMLRSAISVKEP